MCKRGMRGHFMLVVYVSMLVMMIFMLLFKVVLPYCWCFCSGNFGTSLPQTFTLIVWRWGRICCCFSLFVVSFRGRYCGSLSCLSYIYVGSLARLLRPLCPRHLRICRALISHNSVASKRFFFKICEPISVAARIDFLPFRQSHQTRT